MTTTTAAPTFATLDTADLKTHPDNPRTALGDLAELTSSIAEVGIVEPIVVAPRHDSMTARSMGKATWLVLCGHRRLAAAKKAGLKQVPAIIRPDLTTRAAQIEHMLVENLQRVDLTPVEEADSYQLLLDMDGLTQADVAKRLGQPVSRVRDRLKLAKIGEGPRKALQAHQITIETALQVAEFDDDPKTQAKILKKVGTNDFNYTLSSARREREEAHQLREAIAILEKAGGHHATKQPAGSKTLKQLGLNTHEWDVVKKARAVVKAHGTCPGRVSWTYDHYGTTRLEHGCLDPSLHPKAAAPKKSKAELAREAKEKAAKEALAAAHADAAASREAFLTGLLQILPLGRQLEHRLVELIVDATRLDVDYYYGADWRRDVALLTTLLGLQSKVPEKSKDHDQEKALRRGFADTIRTALVATGSGDLSRLALLLDLQTSEQEGALRRDMLHSREVGGWIQTLHGYGYEWSTWELEHFVAGRHETGEDGAGGYVIRSLITGEIVAGDEAEEDAADA